MNARAREQPITDQGPNNTDGYIADESESISAHQFASQPACNEANHDYDEKTLIQKYAPRRLPDFGSHLPHDNPLLLRCEFSSCMHRVGFLFRSNAPITPRFKIGDFTDAKESTEETCVERHPGPHPQINGEEEGAGQQNRQNAQAHRGSHSSEGF
jgi:hypothetical protein